MSVPLLSKVPTFWAGLPQRQDLHDLDVPPHQAIPNEPQLEPEYPPILEKLESLENLESLDLLSKNASASPSLNVAWEPNAFLSQLQIQRLYQGDLSINELQLEPEYPSTAINFDNLSELYQQQKQSALSDKQEPR